MSLPQRPPRGSMYLPSPPGFRRGDSPVGSMRSHAGSSSYNGGGRHRGDSDWRQRPQDDVYVPENYRPPYSAHGTGWEPDHHAIREREERQRVDRDYGDRHIRREGDDRRRGDDRYADRDSRAPPHPYSPRPEGFGNPRKQGPVPPSYASPHPRYPSPRPQHDRSPPRERFRDRGRSRSPDRRRRSPSPPRAPAPSPPRRRPDVHYERPVEPPREMDREQRDHDRRDSGREKQRDAGWSRKPDIRDRPSPADMPHTRERPREETIRRDQPERGEFTDGWRKAPSPSPSTGQASTPHTRRPSPGRVPSPTTRRQAEASPSAASTTMNRHPSIPPTPPTEPRLQRSNTQLPSAKPTPMGPARRTVTSVNGAGANSWGSVNEAGSRGGGGGSGWGSLNGGWGDSSPKPKPKESIVATPPKRASLTASLDAEIAQLQAQRAKEAKHYEGLRTDFRQARHELFLMSLELRSATLKVDTYEQEYERFVKGLPICSEEDMEWALQA